MVKCGRHGIVAAASEVEQRWRFTCEAWCPWQGSNLLAYVRNSP
jgi:hypothetical protein